MRGFRFAALAGLPGALALVHNRTCCLQKEEPPSRQGVLSAIGNTPLIELKSLSKLTGCRIFAKVPIRLKRLIKSNSPQAYITMFITIGRGEGDKLICMYVESNAPGKQTPSPLSQINTLLTAACACVCVRGSANT